jgi:CRP-like cAMP-binding protein
MARKQPPQFDPKVFLSKVGSGKLMLQSSKPQLIFSQGDAADAVFYVQAGQVKLTVVSEQGKEAIIAVLEPGSFFGEGCLAGQLGPVNTNGHFYAILRTWKSPMHSIATSRRGCPRNAAT